MAVVQNWKFPTAPLHRTTEDMKRKEIYTATIKQLFSTKSTWSCLSISNTVWEKFDIYVLPKDMEILCDDCMNVWKAENAAQSVVLQTVNILVNSFREQTGAVPNHSAMWISWSWLLQGSSIWLAIALKQHLLFLLQCCCLHLPEPYSIQNLPPLPASLHPTCKCKMKGQWRQRWQNQTSFSFCYMCSHMQFLAAKSQCTNFCSARCAIPFDSPNANWVQAWCVKFWMKNKQCVTIVWMIC